MVNLSPFVCVEINEYDNITNSKRNPRKSRLGVLRPRILTDYGNYSANFSTIHLRPLSIYIGVNETDDLQHCYNTPTIPLQKLVKNIIDAQTVPLQHVCGFCLYNHIEETDHYIPKEEYPEFSVLASNLIPICSTCNKSKLQYWRTTNNSRRSFLHLYKDILPNIQFLFGTLNFVSTLPQFTWTINNNNGQIAQNIFDIISDHFEKLHLADRYRKACISLLSDIDTSVKAQKRVNPTISGATIADILKEESLEEINKYGINYWKAIARNLLANNQQFINSL